MKEIMIPKNFEIINNLDAILATIEFGNKEMVSKVKHFHDEMAKKHTMIPFVVLTNNPAAFDPERPPTDGQVRLLILNPATHELVGHLHIDLIKETIHRVIIQD